MTVFFLLLIWARRPNDPASMPGQDAVSPRPVGFDLLGDFEVVLPRVIEDEQGLFVHADTPVLHHLPPAVRALDGKRVNVSGFMQPITLNKGKVDEFLLLRDRDTCCFGGTPRVNHWIGVKMTTGATAARLGRPVSVTGRLAVREIRVEGVVVGLYTLEAEAVSDWPRDPSR